MTVPDVTVVVAVYNAMPYLTKCLDSLVGQSIGLDRMQIVAVDDGSTDRGGKLLDRYAQRYPGTFVVLHQANSGSPAAPSNRGLEHATGRYVFFIGADDYLGPEALARLVAGADRHGSDVMLGRMVGVNGRYVPQDIFASTQVDIDLFDSPLPFALSNTKLFRRDLLEKHDVRYPEDFPVGSDQPFTLAACVHATRISALADYDYYYAVRRRDEGNITYRFGLEERLRCTEAIMGATARLIEAGSRREAIDYRHFNTELSRLLRADFLRLDRAAQQRLCDGIGKLARERLTDGVAARLDVARRLRFYLARDGHLDALISVIGQDTGRAHPGVVLDGDRLYTDYDCLRDTRLSLPKSWFYITDAPAESVARRVEVTDVSWGAGRGGARTLNITARGPAELASASVRWQTGSVVRDADVHAEPGGAGGTVVRAAFAVHHLLAGSRSLGERQAVRILVEVDGLTSDVSVRIPSGLAMSARLGRRGSSVYRLNPAKNHDGRLMIDIVPVTMGRIVGRLRRKLRQGRK